MIYYFCKYFISFSGYSHYSNLNNKLNGKCVEEIKIGEKHVCISLVFAFPFCDVGYV